MLSHVCRGLRGLENTSDNQKTYSRTSIDGRVFWVKGKRAPMPKVHFLTKSTRRDRPELCTHKQAAKYHFKAVPTLFQARTGQDKPFKWEHILSEKFKKWWTNKALNSKILNFLMLSHVFHGLWGLKKTSENQKTYSRTSTDGRVF